MYNMYPPPLAAAQPPPRPNNPVPFPRHQGRQPIDNVLRKLSREMGRHPISSSLLQSLLLGPQKHATPPSQILTIPTDCTPTMMKSPFHSNPRPSINFALPQAMPMVSSAQNIMLTYKRAVDQLFARLPVPFELCRNPTLEDKKTLISSILPTLLSSKLIDYQSDCDKEKWIERVREEISSFSQIFNSLSKFRKTIPQPESLLSIDVIYPILFHCLNVWSTSATSSLPSFLYISNDEGPSSSSEDYSSSFDFRVLNSSCTDVIPLNELATVEENLLEIDSSDEGLWGEAIETKEGRISRNRYISRYDGGSTFFDEDMGLPGENERKSRLRAEANIQRVMSTFRRKNSFEKALSLFALQFDMNDESLLLSDLKTHPLHNLDSVSVSSSGSVSMVVDDNSKQLNSNLRRSPDVENDMKLHDKKKRLKEKEMRINHALLGLGPRESRLGFNPNQAARHHGICESQNVDHRNQRDKTCNSIEEFRRLKRNFKVASPMDRLRISFDAEGNVRDPYQSGSGREATNASLELRHASPAFNFVGVPPKPFFTYTNRFHRPDFRTGLYEAHMATLEQPKKVPANGSLWGVWNVGAPEISDIMRKVKCAQVSEEERQLDQPTHPADLISCVEDLTMSDCIPIAVLEYVEQQVPIVNNIGMACKATRHYRPTSEPMSIEYANKKIRGRLGRFGELKLADAYLPFFGSQMRVYRNQGVVVLQSKLFKSQLFPHPVSPSAPLKAPPTKTSYGSAKFHDYRSTDFLLIRRLTKQGATLENQVFIRSLYIEPETAAVDSNPAAYNIADCWVYTVGQTQPIVEVPTPTSKKCHDIRRDWLRSYAYRLAAQGISDFQQVKAKCLSKFSNIFDTGIFQKHLLSCKDNSTSTATGATSFQGTSSGTNVGGIFGQTNNFSIRVLEEDQLRNVCLPESVCVLEQAMVSSSLLNQAGITLLRTADAQLFNAVREIEDREALAREKVHQAIRTIKSYDRVYHGILKSFPPSHVLKTSIPLDETNHEYLLSSHKRSSAVARFIEETLLLTSWNITKDCLDITTRQGGQFSLSGIGDPSGGRGEGLSLLKLQQRRSPDVNTSAKQGVTRPMDSQKEDLRKLSMKELYHRLVKLGFNEQTVKSLPRWDQVALVRRFQCSGGANIVEDEIGKSGRLSSDLYVSRLNEILLNQRRALEPDEPNISGSDSETNNMNTSNGAGEQLNGLMLEEELFAGLGLVDDLNDEEEECVTAESQLQAETRALEDFRSSMKATTPPEGVLSLFTPLETRLLQNKAIPRLKWTREGLDARTGQVRAVKVVYIYGYQNIKFFNEWRETRGSYKRLNHSTTSTFQSYQVGTASRTCRKCGQLGHISSNPICPRYNGSRKSRTGGSVVPNSSRGGSNVGSDEDAGTSTTTNRKRVADGRPSATGSSARPKKNLKTATQVSTSSFAPKPNQPPPAVKLPTRTTARQRHILACKGGSVVGNAVQVYQGSLDSAKTELNQILQRVLAKCDREKRKWALFKSQVSEAEAPGYAAVVQNPMYLDKIAEKCKSKEYENSQQFLGDVELIIKNCKLYNPVGHWIHPVAQALGEFLTEEIVKQGPWLTELDRFILEVILDVCRQFRRHRIKFLLPLNSSSFQPSSNDAGHLRNLDEEKRRYNGATNVSHI